MKHSKRSLFLLCIVCIFLLVYGTVIILRLMLGDFLLDGGLTDVNYVLLALFCAVPFLIYLLVSKNRVTEVILTSGLFFLILFVYVNFMLVSSMTEMSQAIVVRLLIIFPMVALILVVVLHFVLGKDIGKK